MRYITFLFPILFLFSCTKDNSPGKDFLDREFFFNDQIYRVDTKKSSWIESSKYYQCPTIGTPVVFYVEFTEKPVPGKYKVVNNSELGGGKSSMTITKWDITTGNLETWKSQSGDLRVSIIDSVLLNNVPTQLVKFEFGGPVELISLSGEKATTTGIFYSKN